MSLTTVLSSSTTLGGKALLEKADRCFRLSQFDSAFKSCDDAVKSSDFTTSWKDKKRHEVIKTYIVYGRQSGKSQAVLKWLTENKAQLSDYPLYLCEWVHVELGDKDPKKLRVGSHEALKKSEQHLSTVISELTAEESDKGASKIVGMCVQTLIDKVMIPSGQVAKAEQLMKEHSHHLQKDSEAALKKRIQEARKPAATTRATTAPQARAQIDQRRRSGTGAAATPIDPNSIMGQLTTAYKAVRKALGENMVVFLSSALLVWTIRRLLSNGEGAPEPPSTAPLD